MLEKTSGNFESENFINLEFTFEEEEILKIKIQKQNPERDLKNKEMNKLLYQKKRYIKAVDYLIFQLV